MSGWILKDYKYKESYQLKETLFSVANGYLGVRGCFEEGREKKVPTVRGTYINAFYEKEEIVYGEKLHGFPENSESILNVISTQDIQIKIDGETIILDQGDVLSFERSLNFKTGINERIVKWKSPKGNEVFIKFQRLASFSQRELFLMNIEVEALNFDGEIEIISSIDGDVSNIVVAGDPRVGSVKAKVLAVSKVLVDKNSSYIKADTKNSKLSVVAGISHKFNKNQLNETIAEDSKKVTHHFKGNLKKGNKVYISKFVAYTDTNRHQEELTSNIEILNNALLFDFNHFASLQETYLASFWKKADVQIVGDQKMQQGIRFNIFHLLQSVGKDKWSNISAKGLSSEGYEGHYFWDTEIYIFPFFLFTNPDLAKDLLNYRYTILDAARTRAKQMGHDIGALFPWRTIAGEECSPFFPAGTAQYHINVDIAYSVIQYYVVTEDTSFMAEKGLEMLIEISRLMNHIGHYRHDGKFCIDAVTGPDEYTCIVNNNYYTNVLTKNLFDNITKLYNEVKETKSAVLKQVVDKLKFNEDELIAFQKAGEAMYLPFDKERNLHPQDDSFFNKKVWDFENTPKENYPLLLNYHPLTLYRHQVCKQADTLLGHFLLESETTIDVIKNDYHYYKEITTHDSSLSTCIFSIMANRIGEHDEAYDFFMNTARLDIENLHHNTQNGIHTACMGGSWMSIVFGFAGVRIVNGTLNFRPHLPKKWKELRFTIKFKNRVLDCYLTGNEIKINLVEGDSIALNVNNIRREISLRKVEV